MVNQSSKDSIDDIVKYYESNSEDQRFDIQQLEYLLTLRLLEKYLKGHRFVLEVGAGTGWYTLPMLSQGHQVTTLELVPVLAEIIRQKVVGAKYEKSARIVVGDARDLKSLVQETFDATLVMGPLYHLVEESDRIALMKSVYEKTRPNGIVITTHLSRIGLIGYMLARFPMWGIDSSQVDQILNQGYLPNHPRNGDFRGYFTTVDEIRKSHEAQGLKVIAIHSQDPCIGSVDEVFNDIPKDLKAHWLEVLERISSDPLALGSGRSIMCVSVKTASR